MISAEFIRLHAMLIAYDPNMDTVLLVHPLLLAFLLAFEFSHQIPLWVFTRPQHSPESFTAGVALAGVSALLVTAGIGFAIQGVVPTFSYFIPAFCGLTAFHLTRISISHRKGKSLEMKPGDVFWLDNLLKFEFIRRSPTLSGFVSSPLLSQILEAAFFFVLAVLAANLLSDPFGAAWLAGISARVFFTKHGDKN